MPNIRIIGDKPPTLEEAQEIVGGNVQMLLLIDGRQMLVDEDGLAKKKPLNVEATKLVAGLYNGNVVGDVLILSGPAKWR